MKKPVAPNAHKNQVGSKTVDRQVPSSSSRKITIRRISPIIKQTKPSSRIPNPLPTKLPKPVTFGQNFSLTMGVVIVVLAVLVLVVAPPAFNLINKYEARNKAAARLQQVRKENQHLRDQVELWDQPDFIKQEARERLGYVEPGETRFKVVDPGPEYHPRVDSLLEKVPQRPWFLEITHSTRLAGEEHPNHETSGARSGQNIQIAPGADQDPPKPKKQKQH